MTDYLFDPIINNDQQKLCLSHWILLHISTYIYICDT